MIDVASWQNAPPVYPSPLVLFAELHWIAVVWIKLVIRLLIVEAIKSHLGPDETHTHWSHWSWQRCRLPVRSLVWLAGDSDKPGEGCLNPTFEWLSHAACMFCVSADVSFGFGSCQKFETVARPVCLTLGIKTCAQKTLWDLRSSWECVFYKRSVFLLGIYFTSKVLQNKSAVTSEVS